MKGNLIRCCRSAMLATFSFKHLRVRYCYLLICSGSFCRNPPQHARALAASPIAYSLFPHTHIMELFNSRADVQAEGDCRPDVQALIRAFSAASLLSRAPGASVESQGLLPNSASLIMHDTSMHASKVFGCIKFMSRNGIYDTLKL